MGDPFLVAAFGDAGYSYPDSLALAGRWGLANELDAKAKAGESLAAGTPLAVSSLADPSAAENASPEELAAAFAAAGYDGDDAAVLAGKWGVNVDRAVVEAGRELKVVGVLPFVDPPATVANGADLEAEYEAFFAAGYDHIDAPLLAEHWGLPGIAEAKAKAGGLLLAGQPLPEVVGVEAGS